MRSTESNSSSLSIIRFSNLGTILQNQESLNQALLNPIKININGRITSIAVKDLNLVVCKDSGDMTIFNFAAQSEKHIQRVHSSVSSN